MKDKKSFEKELKSIFNYFNNYIKINKYDKIDMLLHLYDKNDKKRFYRRSTVKKDGSVVILNDIEDTKNLNIFIIISINDYMKKYRLIDNPFDDYDNNINKIYEYNEIIKSLIKITEKLKKLGFKVGINNDTSIYIKYPMEKYYNMINNVMKSINN